MFFPYSTDAPIYHRPWTTIGLIVANVLLFWGSPGISAFGIRPLALHYGTINPELAETGRRYLHKLDPAYPLPESLYLQLIGMFQQRAQYSESIPVRHDYLRL